MGIGGSGFGPKVGPQVGQINQQQQQDIGQLQQQQKPGKVKGKSPLDVGFERGRGKVANEVAAKALQVRNPIIDGDEDFADFDAAVANSASKSANATALALEGFDASEVSQNGVGGMAAFLTGQSFTPTEENLAKMQTLAGSTRSEVPDDAALGNLRANLSKGMGVSLPENMQFGEMAMLAGASVGGGDVTRALGPDGEVDPGQLMNLTAGVLRNGGKAVKTAADMAGGINLELSKQITMVKR